MQIRPIRIRIHNTAIQNMQFVLTHLGRKRRKNTGIKRETEKKFVIKLGLTMFRVSGRRLLFICSLLLLSIVVRSTIGVQYTGSSHCIKNQDMIAKITVRMDIRGQFFFTKSGRELEQDPCQSKASK
jgi:hypothetical protein